MCHKYALKVSEFAVLIINRWLKNFNVKNMNFDDEA